jgi:hypothetical protein
MVNSATLDAEPDVELADDAAYVTMLGRLNKLSVEKHFDAYADIPWDEPDFAIDATDPRFRLPATDPIAATDWYRGLSVEQQSVVAAYRFAACMRIGWHFENLLQRGLLTHAFRTPNGAKEFRYLNHEIIEESQHTLMFQEFVDRTGLPVRGMPRSLRFLAEVAVLRIMRLDPSLFFLFVLGGEDPADHLQRSMLRDGLDHPAVERIMRIHVTEEARHLSFARHYLKRQVPKLGRLRRTILATAAPLIMGGMARMMLEPPADLRRYVGLPGSVARAAFRTEEGRQLRRESVAKTRKLCAELGLITGPAKLLWRAAGVWDEPAADRHPVHSSS